jgi:hypothetical protein
MRNATKVGLVVAAAMASGILISIAMKFTARDAMLDFLDEQSANKVADYYERTALVRGLGLALALLAWTGLVFAIGRVIDAMKPAGPR